jgi:glutathione synthase/RimK-type ligase-like ATP-grasp enzyme
LLLIFTHRRGFEADAVIDVLNQRGVPFLRFNTDDPSARLSLDPLNLSGCWLACDGRTANLLDFDAGWLQQDVPNPALDTSLTTLDRLGALNRFAALEFLLSHASVDWLSRPSDVRGASNKLHQLTCAATAGFRVPATRVTNDLDAARSIPTEMGLVVKNLASPWVSGESGISLAYTREFDSSTVTAEQVGFAPLIYQERLLRRRDIRVVVVGERLFAAAMASDDTSDARSVPLIETDYRPYELEATTAAKVSNLCRVLGLAYASIDLVEDVEGRLFFLEVNTTGAFLWLEKLCGFPIAETIADHLVELPEK